MCQLGGTRHVTVVQVVQVAVREVGARASAAAARGGGGGQHGERVGGAAEEGAGGAAGC